MAKMTLLELVQSVMNSMDDQLVSSISDLEISEQIALEAKNTYFDLMQSSDWPHLEILTQLTALADSAKPNYMSVPADLTEVYNIRYNVATAADTQPKWENIKYLSCAEFLSHVQSRNPSESNIQTVNSFESVPLYIRNDIGPTYWTSFDDNYIVFDSFDSGVDSTLQASKSSCLGKDLPAWTAADSFIPDMPAKLFPAFLAELKRKCFVYFKDTQSPEDIRTSFRALAVQRSKASQTNGVRRVRYGRK